jgi:hypothetical protein
LELAALVSVCGASAAQAPATANEVLAQALQKSNRRRGVDTAGGGRRIAGIISPRLLYAQITRATPTVAPAENRRNRTGIPCMTM